MSTTWFVYLVRCSGGELYTGISPDPTRRFAQHEAGRGAKFLRGRGPLELLFVHPVGERGPALKVERAIKRLPRERKEALIADVGARESLFRELDVDPV